MGNKEPLLQNKGRLLRITLVIISITPRVIFITPKEISITPKVNAHGARYAKNPKMKEIANDVHCELFFFKNKPFPQKSSHTLFINIFITLQTTMMSVHIRATHGLERSHRGIHFSTCQSPGVSGHLTQETSP